jgi:WD domain, G-beta repeat
VREVEGEPGALPLLSHAMRRTWERREGRTLTVAGYRETGGIREAIAQSAEEVYERTPPENRSKLRDVLLRLVLPSADGEPVASRLPRRLVATDVDQERIVESLVTARLVIADDGAVELAHEVLARSWPRLRSWLDDDVEGHRILRHLTMAADGWEALGHPDGELYRGGRLAQVVEWRDRAQPKLTPNEQAFLLASSEREAADLRAAQAQVTKERRRVRRLRALVAGVAALAVHGVVASLVAWDQRNRADDAASVAEARRVAAQALVERPYDRALLLAVEAVRLSDSPETQGNLVTTIERSPRVSGVIRSAGPRLVDLAVAATGGTVAVADNADNITLYDPSTRVALGTLNAPERVYRQPEFSPDGRHVAVATMATECWYGPCSDFGVEVYDARDTDAEAISYAGLEFPAADVSYSRRGDLLAAVSPPLFDGRITVWRADQPGEPLLRLTLSEPGEDVRVTPDLGPRGWVRLSPDGTRLYASGAGPTVVYELPTGQQIRTFDGLGGLALSPDGRTLAAARTTTRVGLFDVDTGVLRTELVGHDGTVTRAVFSADGTLVATVSNDETAAVWEVATGQRLQVLSGHAGSVLGVGFDPEGSQLYTAGADGSIILWDLDRTRGLGRDVVDASRSPLGGGTPWAATTAGSA